jgi:hypothetical protein
MDNLDLRHVVEILRRTADLFMAVGSLKFKAQYAGGVGGSSRGRGMTTGTASLGMRSECQWQHLS